MLIDDKLNVFFAFLGAVISCGAIAVAFSDNSFFLYLIGQFVIISTRVNSLIRMEGNLNDYEKDYICSISINI